MRPCDYNDGYDDDPIQQRPPELNPTTNEWTAPIMPRIGERVDKIVEDIDRRAALGSVCESPIEVHLGAALVVEARADFEVVPQFKLSRYRYDFAIVRKGEAKPVVLVECDSAQFHATAEQLANDNAKNVAALDAGLRVIRVRGKEIYRNPQAWAAFIIGECCR